QVCPSGAKDSLGRDLVDIEDSPVGRREQTWPKGSPAFAEGPLEVERADYPIFGRPERQLHKRHGPLDLAPRRPIRLGSRKQPFRYWVIGRRVDRAALANLNRGEQIDERSGRCALGRSLLAGDEHAADLWIDGIEQQCQLQLVLADEG